MCECYQIGGPFIAEDPDCPVHGHEAVREREEREAREADLVSRVERLEALLLANGIDIDPPEDFPVNVPVPTKAEARDLLKR